MTEQRTEEFSAPHVNVSLAVTGDTRSSDTATDVQPNAVESHDLKPTGEAKPAANTASRPRATGERKGEKAEEPKKLSAAKLQLQNRLPALEDDATVGVEKEHIVVRDGKADLLFLGVLLASAAPETAPKGTWQEYRIYQTNGGKHVFSKISRNVLEEEEDKHEAEVFDPTPASMPSQLLRSAREIARAKPVTWRDAAASFFGYDPLAKALYRKLDVRFEEQIS